MARYLSLLTEAPNFYHLLPSHHSHLALSFLHNCRFLNHDGELLYKRLSIFPLLLRGFASDFSSTGVVDCSYPESGVSEGKVYFLDASWTPPLEKNGHEPPARSLQ